MYRFVFENTEPVIRNKNTRKKYSSVVTGAFTLTNINKAKTLNRSAAKIYTQSLRELNSILADTILINQKMVFDLTYLDYVAMRKKIDFCNEMIRQILFDYSGQYINSSKRIENIADSLIELIKFSQTKYQKIKYTGFFNTLEILKKQAEYSKSEVTNFVEQNKTKPKYMRRVA